LDPRTKLIIIFFYVIVVFFANNALSYGLLTVFVFVTVFSTHIPFRFILKGLTPIWFLIIFTFLLHLFFIREVRFVFSLFSFSFWIGKCLFLVYPVSLHVKRIDAYLVFDYIHVFIGFIFYKRRSGRF